MTRCFDWGLSRRRNTETAGRIGTWNLAAGLISLLARPLLLLSYLTTETTSCPVSELTMPTADSAHHTTALAEIFAPENIVIGLRQRTKPEGIGELLHLLVERRQLEPTAAETVLQNILTREQLGTTALGNGIAFPHCRTSCTEKFVGVLGIEPRGIPFDAVDGEPIRAVFLLLAPLEGREELYTILGRIGAIGRDKGLRLHLLGCRTAGEAHVFLQELDRQ